VNGRQLTLAALAYFGLVLCAGFLLGTLRVLWIVPHTGARFAELAEIPFMLAMVYLAARRVVRRFAVPSGPGVRLAIGLIALACLLVAEFTVVIWVQGITIRESIANHDPVSGTAYLVSLILFALMPLWVSRVTPSISAARLK